MTPLSYDEAAHLLRRAGFGGTFDEVNARVGRTREKAVDALLNYEALDDREAEDRLISSFEFLRLATAAQLTEDNFNETELRAWWLAKLMLTRRPLQEKMALFWHNHFATSLDKVPAVHMYTQNLDLRRLALGRFDDLLLAVSRGAAMLIWLDGVTSTKEQPNENFAREIQEVFSMGTHDAVTGEANYTEGDVREIARAFTGWRFRKKAGDGSPFAYEYYVDAGEYDAGSKTIYGQAANFSGEDVIATLAARRSTARYLVKRLFDFFVYPLDLATANDQATVEKFADAYFAGDHSIKALLRAILISDEFFSERARYALVKTPVEFVISAVKILRAGFVTGSTKNRDAYLDRSLRDMGMDLFRPPDVFGWNLNLGFINSRTMLERINFLDYLMSGRSNSADPGPSLDYNYLHALAHKKANATVTNVLNALGPIEVDEATAAHMETYLTTRSSGAPVVWKQYRKTIEGRAKVSLLMQLIMSLPEFQLK